MLPAEPRAAEPVNKRSVPDALLLESPVPRFTAPDMPIEGPLAMSKMPDPEEEAPVVTCKSPLAPDALRPEATMTPPLEPCAELPDRRDTRPEVDLPVELAEENARIPEPVDMPTPDETITSPPMPVEAEEEPAEICTEPPLS